MDILITGIIGVVATFASGYFSYIFTKKKYNAEVDSDEIENVKKLIDIYQETIDDLKVHNNELSDRINELENQNKEIIRQNEDLKSQIKALENKIDSLNKKPTPSKKTKKTTV